MHRRTRSRGLLRQGGSAWPGSCLRGPPAARPGRGRPQHSLGPGGIGAEHRGSIAGQCVGCVLAIWQHQHKQLGSLFMQEGMCCVWGQAERRRVHWKPGHA